MVYKYIFGPVPSRRLGLSLGVDPVPKKICSLDCVYCEVGRTTDKTLQRKPYVPAEIILSELSDFLSTYKNKIDVITFSGSGEPTLNSDLGKIIKGIRKLTDIKIALLTNGTILWDPDVRKDIVDVDIIMPSLDAVTPEIFKKVNQPYKNLTVDMVIKGEIALRKEFAGEYDLEILIVKGINDKESEYRKLAEVVNKIDPDSVQLNTVVRPPGKGNAKAVDRNELEKLKILIGKKANIIPDFQVDKDNKGSLDLYDSLINMLKIRPCTLDEISTALQVEKETVKMAINGLGYKGYLYEEERDGKVFYKIKEIGGVL